MTPLVPYRCPKCSATCSTFPNAVVAHRCPKANAKPGVLTYWARVVEREKMAS